MNERFLASRRDLLKGAAVGATVGTLTTSTLAQEPAPEVRSGLAVRTSGGRVVDAARDFNVRPDQPDNAPGIQAAIDAGAEHGLPVELPGSDLLIGVPIDLKGRFLRLVGAGMTRTTLRARSDLPHLLDVEDTQNTLVSELVLEDLALDGAGRTEKGIGVRNRHHTAFRNVQISNCAIGLWERDSWINSRTNLRIANCATGLNLVGANHNSHFDRLSVVGSSRVHIAIGNAGSANDGNQALKFTACDVEFGKPGGIGISVAEQCDVTFDTCYIGENIAASIIENRGRVLMLGGTLFFGHAPRSYAVRPLGGRVLVNGTRIAGQAAGGLQNLINLSDAEVDAGRYGCVRFQDVHAYVVVGGSPSFNGDVLDHGPAGIVFAPRLGRDYAAEGSNARCEKTISGGSARFVCTSGGNGGVFAATGRLADASWIQGQPCYLVVVYESDVPLTVAVANGPFGAAYTITVLSPSTRKRTAIKLDPVIPEAAYTHLQFIAQANSGDVSFTLHEVCFADSRATNARTAAFGNLYKM